MSTPYTSGVTDFDTYVSGNPTHSFISNTWISGSSGPGSITFDLGNVFDLDGMAMWGTGGAFSVQNFNLFAIEYIIVICLSEKGDFCLF
ncbi:hypothetical protein MC7420_2272 [Coleofasciculus chthonoplastes PCC 7420]|uniref:Uncharacterized protein n=1 Tax=Coleofasciculus chthonoplastes PCC 7420 TaxID=118168 RepID=B4VSK9_9CYAN|nr:hypothetical protein [Coleofasciculus chthonoplastes]EDX75268.1 hypothetical protein MC7420_2272 [Coleofasciculus chthonoplastes PCC 7420]